MLKLNVCAIGAEVKLELQYDVAHFVPTHVRNLAKMLYMVLQRVVTEPDRPIGSWSLLDAESQQQMAQILRGPSSPLPDWTLPQAFELQAARF